jgi:hypothetical protein
MPVTISNDGFRKIVALVAKDFYPDSKIEAIKKLRELTGFGLKESKDLIEAEFDFRSPYRVDPVLSYIHTNSNALSESGIR